MRTIAIDTEDLTAELLGVSISGTTVSVVAKHGPLTLRLIQAYQSGEIFPLRVLFEQGRDVAGSYFFESIQPRPEGTHFMLVPGSR